ncbi:hypothetical protein PS3A_44340 [Pseudomonas sp. 3A(2025)]
MDKQAISRQASEMPWIKKAAVFLLVLDHALENLKSSGATHATCKEAIELCWQWLSDRSVTGEALAHYLDSDELQDGPLAESHFAAGSVEQDSLILIVLVVGFFAHRAYKVSGQQARMSASVCEADEGAAQYIVEFIDKVGLMDVLGAHLPTRPA